MSEFDWEKEYDRLLAESRRSGQVADADKSEGHRSQPRFHLKDSHVWIRVPTRFDLLEISIAGIAFHSKAPFQVGENLLLTLDKAFSIEAKVVECFLTESDSGFLELRYRVGCAFNDQNHGMQMLVMLKDLERHRQSS